MPIKLSLFVNIFIDAAPVIKLDYTKVKVVFILQLVDAVLYPIVVATILQLLVMKSGIRIVF